MKESTFSQKNQYCNEFSFVFGLLCLAVVYLHSEWTGGFSTYNIGISEGILPKISSMLFMTVVPTFFILWGYLSQKYFYLQEGAFRFFLTKIMQFYPIYFLFFWLNYLIQYPKIKVFPAWKIILGVSGVYYEGGLGGGNIFLPVLCVIFTISLFIFFHFERRGIFLFTATCMILAKFLPHESSLCYLKYFGYYTAFFLGVILREINAFEKKFYEQKVYIKAILYFFMTLGIFTPILNFLGSKIVELEYHPNSPEQLFFATFVCFVTFKLLNFGERIIKYPFFPLPFIHYIGNNAYSHFIIQSIVIQTICISGKLLNITPFLLQIFVIISTSYISLYLILPLYTFVRKYCYAKFLSSLLKPNGSEKLSN